MTQFVECPVSRPAERAVRCPVKRHAAVAGTKHPVALPLPAVLPLIISAAMMLSACAATTSGPSSMSSDTMALQSDEVTATPPPIDDITFVWNAGDGQPDMVIHRTSSITSPVTQELIARDIIAKHRRSPRPASAPLVTTPAETGTQTGSGALRPARTDQRIIVRSVSQKSGNESSDLGPTLLPVAAK